MSTFKDSRGWEWSVGLDAFILDDVRKDTGIDLADISAAGWLKVDTDSGAVGRVLAVVCRDEIKARRMDAKGFVKSIRGGDVITAARAVLMSEGADFFPQSEWSAILSNLEKRKTARDQADTLQTAMAAMEGMSPDFRAGALQALMEAAKDAIVESSVSEPLPGNESAFGQDGTPSNAATNAPENAESPQGD